MGSIASHRYALLNRTPLLPHEELLCKESMLLKSTEGPESGLESHDTISHQNIKAAYVNLIRFQHQIRWNLTRSKQYMGDSTHSHGTILCSICKRDCYIAYINCNCYLHPVCLRHGNFNFKPFLLLLFLLFVLIVRFRYPIQSLSCLRYLVVIRSLFP